MAGEAAAAPRALLVAGTASGVGKTTFSLALMAALARRGLAVQAFKVGPDFIDPGHHALVTGRPSHNLDGWMLSPAENRAIFARHAGAAGAAGAPVAVVEGVMGLYDGFSGRDERGSSAEMVKLLGLPVLLLADARSLARSFAALVGGYLGFDPGLAFAGVVANRVGGPAHRELLKEAAGLVPGARLLGCLPREPAIRLGERHLGLVTAEEGEAGPEFPARLAAWLEEGLDLDRLLAGLPEVALPPPPLPPPLPPPAGERVVLAVARDRAFCFYYQENLRRLAEAGAELAFFSPLAGEALPPGTRGLYLGGGYPELYAARLAAHRELAGEIVRRGRAGMPIYAECGGMMYLGRELEDLEGRRHPMAGLLPLAFRLLPRLRSLGYREVRFARSTPLGPAGTVARGHEFHYSEPVPEPLAGGLDPEAYRAAGREGRLADCRGFMLANTLASYVHLHFGSHPGLAPHLVAACRAWRG